MNKIAIVRLSALGDIVNSALVLQFIHKHYPNAEIEWITEELFAPLLQGHPLLHKVHTINLKRLKKEKSLTLLKETISKLRSLGEFDLIIDMQGLLKSAIVARLIGKNTHGFDKDSSREALSSLFYKTSSHIAYTQNVIKRNCFLVADALGFLIDDAMILAKEPLFEIGQQFSFNQERKNIAIVIGASWESKKYPKERVVELSNALKENILLIWGNETEREEAAFIAEHSEYAILAPKLSLPELVSFISQVDLLIGNDTGPTHMAWAQNIPSITLLGPTTTRMIYETPKNRGIKSPSSVNLNKIDKNDFSLQEIEVERIAQNARELLSDGI
ncbi:MAG: lipopolysaccharide heptosyltransferase I [Sulfurimonas sp.]|nr:lipopolysaccharide heptosyltransferase I [Sulfurimonas sp.]